MWADKGLQMFRITEGRGFQMTFENGWTVSVQFGVFNYCANKNAVPGAVEKGECADAEIAAWNSKGRWFSFGSDEVKGWVSPDEVAEFMVKISKML
jgi:hypothetical protein